MKTLDEYMEEAGSKQKNPEVDEQITEMWRDTKHRIAKLEVQRQKLLRKLGK